MGITTNDFFENIYSIIFSPKAFFEREEMTVSVRLALATVIFISLIYNITKGIFDTSIVDASFIFTLIFKTVFAVFFWFITALLFEYIAKIFDKDGNLNKLLFYTAFAPVPYIFFAPLNLVKHAGAFAFAIASLIEFCLFIWIIYLYSLALKATYKISNARAFMLILIPFISAFFALFWIVCFFIKLCYIFSI